MTPSLLNFRERRLARGNRATATSQWKRYSSRSGCSASARARPSRVLLRRQQLERRVRLRADDVERPLARDRARLRRAARPDVGEARGGELGAQRRLVGEARRVSSVGHRREPAREPDVVEARPDPRSRSTSAAGRARGSRATSANARGRSTRWTAMRITAASNQPRLNGSASARATRALTPRLFARATISLDASTAQTRASARSSSACASRPVPQPISSTRAPRSSPSSTSRSKSSHQFASTGRSSS